MMLVIVSSDYFYCGLVFDNNIVKCAPPILKYMIGWDTKQVTSYCNRKGFSMAKYGNRRGRGKRQQSKPKGDPPIQEFKFGQCKVCVWEKETDYGTKLSYSLHKSWKPEDGDWVNERIGVYREVEFINIIQACQAALDFRYGPDSDEDDDDLGLDD